MKTFAVVSVVALVLFLIGLDFSLQKKQQRLEEERAKAAREEEVLSQKKAPVEFDKQEFLRRTQQGTGR